MTAKRVLEEEQGHRRAPGQGSLNEWGSLGHWDGSHEFSLVRNLGIRYITPLLFL